MTRVDPAMAEIVRAEMPELTYHPLSRLLVLDRSTLAEKQPGILVVIGGIADLPEPSQPP